MGSGFLGLDFFEDFSPDFSPFSKSYFSHILLYFSSGSSDFSKKPPG